MITEKILLALFSVANFVVGLLPDFASSNVGGSGFSQFVGKALFFFPADVLVVGIGNIVLIATVGIGWSVIEWVYKKVPGVD